MRFMVIINMAKFHYLERVVHLGFLGIITRNTLPLQKHDSQNHKVIPYISRLAKVLTSL